jgi:hypothetical protein
VISGRRHGGAAVSGGVDSARPEGLQALVGRIEARVLELCERTGIRVRRGAGEEEAEDPEQLKLFDELKAASIRELVGLSPDGEVRRVRTVGKTREDDPAHAEEDTDGESADPGRPRPLAAHSNGFSVHAGVRIEGKDGAGLARLGRYALRPPFAEDRFELREPAEGGGGGGGGGGRLLGVDGKASSEGTVYYRLRRPRRDGTTQLALTAMELPEKLAALVPRRVRDHDVHYQGVLAPNARWRKEVVPGGEEPAQTVQAAARPRWRIRWQGALLEPNRRPPASAP